MYHTRFRRYMGAALSTTHDWSHELVKLARPKSSPDERWLTSLRATIRLERRSLVLDSYSQYSLIRHPNIRSCSGNLNVLRRRGCGPGARSCMNFGEGYYVRHTDGAVLSPSQMSKFKEGGLSPMRVLVIGLNGLGLSPTSPRKAKIP